MRPYIVEWLVITCCCAAMCCGWKTRALAAELPEQQVGLQHVLDRLDSLEATNASLMRENRKLRQHVPSLTQAGSWPEQVAVARPADSAISGPGADREVEDQRNIRRLPAVELEQFDVAFPSPTRVVVSGDLDVQPASFLVQSGQAPLGTNAVVSTSPVRSETFGVGADFYSAPDFAEGLIIRNESLAMKIGGYVKADFIYDFDPIDSTDSFDTTTIPVDAAPRTNARFHARQTRLSFDTRWLSDRGTVKVFLEGDFFSEGERYRLRHAYGEAGSLLVGKTWTTFTDVAAAPATLDFEGSVSSVNRRQAQARWTQTMWHDDVTLALSLEDTRVIIEAPIGVTGDERTPSPDFVARMRLEREWGQFQIAGLYRVLGFQPTGMDVITSDAWGLNFTGVVLLSDANKAYYQILFGDGIGSYRSLPDAAPTSETRAKLLQLFGWMVGITHNWNEQLSSNFTYAQNSLDSTEFQALDDVRRTTYLAANLIWEPIPRVNFGVEYLYGLRENVDFAVGVANRVQAAFFFYLP